VSAAEARAAGFQEELTQLVMRRAAAAHTAGCAGIVCSGLEVAGVKSRFGREFLAVTPGIRPAWAGGGKDDQARVATPAAAVAAGSDYLVIGRPIRDAADPREAARRVADEIASAI
jgi:orotidine-5'-phosphate decarboxylase